MHALTLGEIFLDGNLAAKFRAVKEGVSGRRSRKCIQFFPMTEMESLNFDTFDHTLR